MNFERYQGLWYEIAKIPFKWENFCDNSTAYYTFDKMTGVLYIENTCFKDGKKVISRKGFGVNVDKRIPFLLKVIFDDGLPNDGLGNYLIEYTDYDNYAIVGTPSKKQLWILSRRSQITDDEYRYVLDIVSNRGYPLDKLVINKV